MGTLFSMDIGHSAGPLITGIIITAVGYTTGFLVSFLLAITFERRRELRLCDGAVHAQSMDIPVCGWLGDVHVNGIQPEHIRVVPIGGQGEEYPLNQAGLSLLCPVGKDFRIRLCPGNPRESGGILNTIQWVNLPSVRGISRIRARLFVPGGIPPHAVPSLRWHLCRCKH